MTNKSIFKSFDCYLLIYFKDTARSLRAVSRVFNDHTLPDWMDFPFKDEFWGKKNPLYGKHAQNMKKTDIRETDGSYELDVDLPGFKKDEIQVQLKDGYLVLSAAKGLDKDEKDKEGNYIRRERYAGSMCRSFYVGDAVSEEDIHAKYEDGILKLSVPKKAPEKIEKDGYIAIEG